MKRYQESLPTQAYAKMTPYQRQQYVQSMSLSDQKFVFYAQECQYPQKQFIELKGIENQRQIKLATFRYKSQIIPIKGVFAILNSYYMHSKYTSHLAKKLSKEGYDVVTFDNRGHGISQGQRGQWNDYQSILKQTFDFLKKVQRIYQNMPLFVLGWGIGGLNALYISLYHYNSINFAGIILASTMFKIPIYSKTYQIIGNIAIKALSIFPNKIGLYPPNYNYFTRYRNVNKIMDDDKLNAHDLITANTVTEVGYLIDDLPQNLWNKIDTPPIVILHGQLDKHGNGYHAFQFYNEIKSKDKQLWYYQKMNFAFLFEEQYPEIEERIVNWLERLVKNYKKKQQTEENSKQNENQEKS